MDLSLFATFDAEGPPGVSTLSGHVVTEAKTVLLELKSADAAASADELRLLLKEMTREMRAQFIAFATCAAPRTTWRRAVTRRRRERSGADLKAATDAMSLIVRTLEKVDSLQRQLARDRAEEAEKRAEDTGFEEALRMSKSLSRRGRRSSSAAGRRRDGTAMAGGRR